MVRRTMVMLSCLAAAALLFGAPQWSAAGDAAKQDKKAAEEKKDDKGTNNDGKVKDGINKAFQGFKKEMDKGKKNLSDLNEREKAKSGK